MIATVLSGLIYFGLSYVSQLDFPSNQFEDVDSGSLDVMLAAGGQFLNVFFTAAYVAGCIGSALTSQASVSRILFAMGRDGILPRKVFGHVSVRFATPTFAILVVSVISLLALWIDLTVLIALVSFGALVAFSAVNLSVIKHYFFDQKRTQCVQQPGAADHRLRADRVAVDQPAGSGAEGRIDLAGNRIRLAARGDTRVPAPDAGARSEGVASRSDDEGAASTRS